MNIGVGSAQVGQWYQRRDKGELFQVTGRDEHSGTIEIQTFDGDLDEIDEDTWNELPLVLAEPPEDWTGPVDDVEPDDRGYTDGELPASHLAQPFEPMSTNQESWTELGAAEEEDEEPEPGTRRPQ